MDRIRNLLMSLAVLSVGGVTMQAQGGYGISGVVTDEYGPVIGAAVVELSTSNGTSTGIDGDFSLTVTGPSAMVEISCIGYISQTFEAASVPSTVVLKADNEYLDEVVVVGYGTVKKDDLTGSISAIKAEDINRGAVVIPRICLRVRLQAFL